MNKNSFVLTTLLLVTLPAQASLEARDLDNDNIVDAVYDSDLDITWLANANLAASNTFGLAYNTDLGDHPSDSYGPSYTEQINVNGSMTWGGALHWIDAMNDANYLGYDDWRLTGAIDTNAPYLCEDTYACIDSDIGHLFYRALVNQPDLANYDPGVSSLDYLVDFSNLQRNFYWLGTEYHRPRFYPYTVYDFKMFEGYQGTSNKSDYLFAWAVRTGDVAAIPEADTWALMLAGLGLVGFAARRKQAV